MVVAQGEGEGGGGVVSGEKRGFVMYVHYQWTTKGTLTRIFRHPANHHRITSAQPLLGEHIVFSPVLEYIAEGFYVGNESIRSGTSLCYKT